MQDHLTALRRGLALGYNSLLDRRADPEVGIDFGVHRLAPGTRLAAPRSSGERALLVLRGRGALSVDGATLPFDRPEWLRCGPFVAHGGSASELAVQAEDECEVAEVAVDNKASFAPRLYGPADVPTEHRGKGLLEDAAYRMVRTVFDRASAPPESRLVLGEVVTLPGRWSSYPPHHHPQPEIYYYRFSPAQGYGHGELGEAVFTLRDHDLLRITANRDHAQVAAPGYHMYYLWAIRHLPSAPYTGFEYSLEHRWLLG
jgi:5-deoxy-glucuronate isomerase